MFPADLPADCQLCQCKFGGVGPTVWREEIQRVSARALATLGGAKVEQVVVLSQQLGISEQQQGVSILFLCVSAVAAELLVNNDCRFAKHRQMRKVKTVCVSSW